jgi:hypothetical protein
MYSVESSLRLIGECIIDNDRDMIIFLCLSFDHLDGFSLFDFLFDRCDRHFIVVCSVVFFIEVYEMIIIDFDYWTNNLHWTISYLGNSNGSVYVEWIGGIYAFKRSIT